jgi:hypothetical protein
MFFDVLVALVSFAAGAVAGAVSGAFGGLVGNQGGIRSAALMGFEIDKQGFVATATAIALVVDIFRMPVYADRVRDHCLCATLVAFAGVGLRLSTIPPNPVPGQMLAAIWRGVVYSTGSSVLGNPI